MSSPSMLGLISAIYVAYLTFVIIADRWAHSRGEIVATGLQGGIPISTELRGLMLYNSWLSLTSGIVASGITMAFAFTGLGRNADDPYVRAFAYLCALQSGFVSVGWGATGITTWLRYYRKVLREAERN